MCVSLSLSIYIYIYIYTHVYVYTIVVYIQYIYTHGGASARPGARSTPARRTRDGAPGTIYIYIYI